MDKGLWYSLSNHLGNIVSCDKIVGNLSTEYIGNTVKIAIVCDWLITHAGAERVLAEILQCFPAADIFAVVDFVPPEKRDFLLNKPVKTTFIQHLLFAKKY